jgi:geranylgeranyl reductase
MYDVAIIGAGPAGATLTWLIGAALHRNDQASRKFKLLKQKLHRLGFQFDKTVHREAALIVRPVNRHQVSTDTKGVVLLGEAAGWISPSSAEGLSYAFRSALMLADALRKSPAGFERQYFQATRRLRINIFLKNLKSHFIFTPRLRKIIMRSGLHSLTLDRP